MTRNNRLVLSFTLVAIIIKMAFFMSGERSLGLMVAIPANIFFILALISITLYHKYKTVKLHESSVIDDVRAAMMPAAKFVLFICVFLFAYYEFIDPDFNAERMAQIIERSELFAQDEVAFQEFIDSDPTLKDMTPEEYVTAQKEKAEILNRPSIRLGASLLILTVLALFYSMAVSILFRKVLLK
jgi:hypothetical protein